MNMTISAISDMLMIIFAMPVAVAVILIIIEIFKHFTDKADSKNKVNLDEIRNI